MFICAGSHADGGKQGLCGGSVKAVERAGRDYA